MSAACVHLIETEEGIKIVKVTSIIDCGMYINPDQVKAQTEGNIVMGLSAAIKGGITFTDGKCDQKNFDSYQFLRISEMPDVEVVIIENDEAPGGVGEPGLPPIAPALGNAIFNLTGKRIRKLPIEMNSLV
jgi:isoquinoline 1-oxidoreductase beta subunit